MIPRPVRYVTALWVALLLGASLLWPMLDGYDEPQHVDMSYVYSGSLFHFYGPGDLPATRASGGMQGQVPGTPPNKPLAEVAVPPRGDRPSFTSLGGRTFLPDSQPDQMVQHPPLYYWTEALLLRVPGMTHIAWDLTVWLMRLLSVLYMLPIPILAWATARRLLAGSGYDHANSLCIAAALIPLTVPNLIRDGSAVSNDSLLILSTSVLTYLLSRVLTGDLRKRTAGWIALALAVALLTKGFGLVLPPIVAAAYVVAGRRAASGAGQVSRTIWRPLAIAAVGAVVGGLWWLRSLVKYGTIQIDGYGPVWERRLYGPPDFRGTLPSFVPTFLNGLISRVWGGIGLGDTPTPGYLIVYGWFAVVFGLVVVALLARGPKGQRTSMWVFAVALILTVGVVAQGSFSTYHEWSNAVRGSQGRYVYQLFTVISALAVVGAAKALTPRINRWLPTALIVGALITNLTAWTVLLTNWYRRPNTGLSGLGNAFATLIKWSPVPAPVSVVLVVVLPTAAALATVVIVIRAREPESARELATSG